MAKYLKMLGIMTKASDETGFHPGFHTLCVELSDQEEDFLRSQGIVKMGTITNLNLLFNALPGFLETIDDCQIRFSGGLIAEGVYDDPGDNYREKFENANRRVWLF